MTNENEDELLGLGCMMFFGLALFALLASLAVGFAFGRAAGCAAAALLVLLWLLAVWRGSRG